MNSAKPTPLWPWLYPILLASTVVWASGHSQVAGPGIVDFDKIAHFSVFGLLATLVLRRLYPHKLAWAVVIVSVFGATDEVHQSFTPGRSMEVDDWLADTLGATVAVCAYAFWPAYRRCLETPLFRRKPRVEISPASPPTVPAP